MSHSAGPLYSASIFICHHTTDNIITEYTDNRRTFWQESGIKPREWRWHRENLAEWDSLAWSSYAVPIPCSPGTWFAIVRFLVGRSVVRWMWGIKTGIQDPGFDLLHHSHCLFLRAFYKCNIFVDRAAQDNIAILVGSRELII
jgi:hypothetical protein